MSLYHHTHPDGGISYTPQAGETSPGVGSCPEPTCAPVSVTVQPGPGTCLVHFEDDSSEKVGTGGGALILASWEERVVHGVEEGSLWKKVFLG